MLHRLPRSPGSLVSAALIAFTAVLGASRQAPSPGSSDAFEALEQQATEVAREVEELRGWKFKGPVKTARASQAEARRHLEAAFDKEYPPNRLAPREAMMRLTGLLPSEGDYRAATLAMLESQVAGFYDTEAKALFLVDQPGTMPPFVLRTILAHELTHALDDQAFDLAAIERAAGDSEDARLVFAALAEGSASALMMQYAARRLVAGQIDAAGLQAYLEQEMARAKLLENLPRGLNSLFASYICGAAFLARKDVAAVVATSQREIGENLVKALKDLPRSSEQIVHPDAYWDAARRDEPVRVDDASAERWLREGTGQGVAWRDTFGELQTAALTEPRDLQADSAKFLSAAAWTNPGAIGWGGDRFFLLEGGETRKDGTELRYAGGVWVTAWDTRNDREEFLAALEKGHAASDRATARVGGRAAVVFFGLPPAGQNRLMAALSETPLAFTKAGKGWTP